jgi:hypothetical protein
MKTGLKRLAIVFGCLGVTGWVVFSGYLISGILNDREDAINSALVTPEQQLALDQLMQKYPTRIPEIMARTNKLKKENRKAVEPEFGAFWTLWNFKWRFISIPVGAVLCFITPCGIVMVIGWVIDGFRKTNE